jgi:HAD superfamily hydrolase (TIGR01509 family)
MKTIFVDAAFTFTIEKNGTFVVFRELHELLDTFHNKKIIVTNANDEQMIKYGLTKLPYEWYSLKHDPDKIDPEYFKKLLEHYRLNADDVVYFEHDEDAVKSAESVGITSFFYDAQKKDLYALNDFLQTNA